ncbi:MAG: 5-formyltetrahydrofolate cyclo-ligase [bacterium]|nr:5-formyltetrahydrofolate cyclo-ligase [bacterium]
MTEKDRIRGEGTGREEAGSKKTENSAHDEKRMIRKNVLLQRDALSQEQRRRGEILLTERILGHQWFYGSEILLAFASCGSEIGTGEIIREALKRGKRVYLPKVISDGEKQPQGKQEMVFFRIGSLGELQPGYRGILEPSDRAERYEYREKEAERVLMLVPGVAFDRFGNRIGYGGGFYDRYLADKEGLKLRTVGVGFRCQLTERLPAEEGDVRPYQVICV